jgi:lipopolysaccharide export system protein LptA
MSNILGINGFKRLQLGYEVYSNEVKTKNFAVAANTEIAPGAILIRTAQTQVYTTAKTSDSAESLAGKVAGIALATNVKLDPLFPQSTDEVIFKAGDRGACVVRGEVAVKLYGTAPAEGDKVYYNVAQGAFTKDAEGNLALPNCQFSGITEGSLTVVNVLY